MPRAGFLVALVLMGWLWQPATGGAVPLPSPRPAALAPKPAVPEPIPDPKPVAPPAPAAAEQGVAQDAAEAETAEANEPTEPVPDPLCDELEASGEVEFERLPRITEGACGGLTPVKIKALVPKDGQKVTLDPVVANCAVAKALLDWTRGSVQPAAAKYLNEPIAAFTETNGYQCRGRNRVSGAKISEHGKANAIDIGGLKTVSGKVFPVEFKEDPALSFLLEIRAAACGPFKTVLGPGSDAYHAEHFHLDMAKRGKDRNTTYCR